MIPPRLLRRQSPVLLNAMRPHRRPRHDHASHRDAQAEYSYNDTRHQDYAWHSYHDPVWSTHNYHDTYGYSNDRMSEYTDRYDVGGERRWEGDGSYGGTSSRYYDHSSSMRDVYRDDGGYPDGNYGNRQGYGNYSNLNHDHSEGRHSSYGSYSSNHRPIYDRNSYRRNNGEQRRRYHSSRSEHNESNTRSSEPNNTSSIASRLFQHSQDNLIRIDTARLLRNSRSPRRNPSPPPMGPDEDYLKTSLEISTKTGIVGGGEDLDVDGRTVVRKLLVLDLNGTLVFRSPYRSSRERYGRGSATGGWPEDDVYARFDPSQPRPLRAVHPRPYLSSFRQYLFHPKTRRWLDTMVWSSAQPHSVNDMIAKCFGDEKSGLVAIWARDKLGLNGIDYGRKVQTTKDLNKPWNELNLTSFDSSDIANSSSSSSSGPQKRTHSARTTLLLDDSPLKAHLQPYSHVCLKEYDSEMRKHDMAVRELTLARTKLADAISKKKTVSEVVGETESKDEDPNMEGAVVQADEGGVAALGTEEMQSSTHLDSQEPGEESTNRKRKRKAKKEEKKKERAEEMLRKLTDENQNAGGVYDETLLAVVGILDTVKTESNIAAWIRAGGLIQSVDISNGKILETESLVSSRTSADEVERPRKKIKLSEIVSSPPSHEDRSGEGLVNQAPPISVTSDPSSPPPTTSSPARASSPFVLQSESGSSSETERTGVPLDDDTSATDKGKGAEEKRLWFDHPGTISYWASRGRAVLEGMGIEIDAGVVGPTG